MAGFYSNDLVPTKTQLRPFLCNGLGESEKRRTSTNSDSEYTCVWALIKTISAEQEK